MKKKAESDIVVLGGGWWCPTMESVFPNQCSHSQHPKATSVRCVVVGKDNTIDAAIRSSRPRGKR